MTRITIPAIHLIFDSNSTMHLISDLRQEWAGPKRVKLAPKFWDTLVHIVLTLLALIIAKLAFE